MTLFLFARSHGRDRTKKDLQAPRVRGPQGEWLFRIYSLSHSPWFLEERLERSEYMAYAGRVSVAMAAQTV